TLTFALLYTILGGFRKVVETDILQFFLVIIGVFIVFFFSIKAVGGWSKIQEIASSYPSSFSRWEIVSFFIVFSFPLWADPSFYQRCSAAKDPRTASLGIAFVGLVDSFMTFVGLGIGLAGVYIIGNNANPDTIFPSLVETILPTGLRELVGLAILSAVMSTVDSYLLIAGGVFANDILHPLGLKWDGVKLSKIGTFLSAIFAFLSLSIFSDIIDAAIFAFSLFASTSLIPLVLALVLGPRSDFVLPSLVSMFAGGVTVIAWKLLKLGDTSVSVLYGLAISGGIWLLLFSFRTFKHLKTRG
ncbi:MAG: Na+/solute symporter, partial [bacterium 42_11]